MNLRVDLILESEQRSGSLVSLKALGRIAAFLLPALLILAVFSAFRNMKEVTDELAELEAQWAEVKPKQIEVLNLNEEFLANRRTRKELEGWRHSRVDWHEQVVGLMREVPGTIQLTRMRINQALQLIDEQVPARVFSLSLEGTAVGEEAEENVQILKRQLQRATPFEGVIEQVEVTRFAKDTAKSAHKDDRTFRVECKFAPREFE